MKKRTGMIVAAVLGLAQTSWAGTGSNVAKTAEQALLRTSRGFVAPVNERKILTNKASEIFKGDYALDTLVVGDKKIYLPFGMKGEQSFHATQARDGTTIVLSGNSRIFGRLEVDGSGNLRHLEVDLPENRYTLNQYRHGDLYLTLYRTEGPDRKILATGGIGLNLALPPGAKFVVLEDMRGLTETETSVTFLISSRGQEFRKTLKLKNGEGRTVTITEGELNDARATARELDWTPEHEQVQGDSQIRNYRGLR